MEAIKNAFDFRDFPRLDLSVAGAVLAFLLVFPALPHSSFAMATMIQFLMFSLYGMGWNTIGGYAGQVDLGKAQYNGIGAYTTAVMMVRWDVPFWVSMPVGMALAVGWSFIIGYPLFRLKGHYFAIATIATSLVLKDLFEVWDFVGAATGLQIPIRPNMPDFLYLQFRHDYYYYYILLAIFVLGLLYINAFRHSRLGFQLRAIKDNEDVAKSLGIDAHWCKRTISFLLLKNPLLGIVEHGVVYVNNVLGLGEGFEHEGGQPEAAAFILITKGRETAIAASIGQFTLVARDHHILGLGHYLCFHLASFLEVA
jgi:branched-chain amino acid transport system permease protein